MAVTTKVTPKLNSRQLRPFNPFRDSAVVADLIETSFSDTLDPDGRRYLHQMRAGSHKGGLNRWAAYAFNSTYPPLAGFVWEENGRVVGNLSLVPFLYKGQRINMIANVAVDPQYRRRGIARALTAAALEKSKRGYVRATWLQVRQDNQAAKNLYCELGFVSRASRTTWVADPASLIGEAPSDTRVSIRKRGHWPQQQRWLDQNYPSYLRWYLLLSVSVMGPGIFAAAYQWFNEMILQHWAVIRDETLLGVLSWQRSHRYADYLWLAASPSGEDEVIETTVPLIRRLRRLDRPLSLDYPENRAVDALTAAGFRQKVTLNWMEVNHDRNRAD
jgi:ribosomal protein S18 acetylase RimI-like enzyme